MLFTTLAQAAPDETARVEIEHLLTALEQSACQFYRNGSWHDATRARAHLQRKYDYLLKKDLVDSAEQFIERAATESSRSGESYQVRCPGSAAISSAEWLGTELEKFRKPAHKQ